MCGREAFLCSICFQPISLNHCAFDEDGRPVHEPCYAAYVLQLPKRSRLNGFWWELRTTLSRITHRK